jgi:acyl carrier protein
MDKNELKTKLTAIFRQIFSDDTLEISETMTAGDVPEWDSLAHISLIVAVEKGFGITFTTREVRSMKNVGDFMALIQKKVT